MKIFACTRPERFTAGKKNTEVAFMERAQISYCYAETQSEAEHKFAAQFPGEVIEVKLHAENVKPLKFETADLKPTKKTTGPKFGEVAHVIGFDDMPEMPLGIELPNGPNADILYHGAEL